MAVGAERPGTDEILGFRTKERDEPRDECGIVAVNTPQLDSGRIAIQAVNILSNRGYDTTGASSVIEGYMHTETGFGDGAAVFPDGGESFNRKHPAHQSAAHARYGTQGGYGIEAAQPHDFEILNNAGSLIQVSHIVNGNLQNTHELAEANSIPPGSYVTDSELSGLLFASTYSRMIEDNPVDPPELKDAVKAVIPHFKGAFMGAAMAEGQTVVYSDRHGLKPAVIGRLPDGGVIIASEVTALDAVGAVFVEEVGPGVIISINQDGSEVHKERWIEPDPKGCILEMLYVMRERGQSGTRARFHELFNDETRYKAGVALAKAAPVEADFVVGLPNSAVTAGRGYAAESGIDYLQIFEAKYEKKSFIGQDQESRIDTVKKKLYIPDRIKSLIKGKRIVVGDDSLIRGTTMDETINMLKECEPSEIHIRIALDKISHICDLGIDLASPEEMIANRKDENGNKFDEAAIARHLGVDSVAFLPVEVIKSDQVLGDKADQFCFGCITGEYPTDNYQVNPAISKLTRKSLDLIEIR